MSTQSPRRDGVARDPTDVYDLVVLKSPTVCATCHQRIRDETDVDEEASHDGLGSGNKPTSVLERAGAGELGHDCEDKDDYGATRRHYTRTFCGECGRSAGTTPSDPASLETMLDRVPALVAALRREDLAPAVDTIYDVVRSLKTSERFDNRDTDIWRTATALAIR